MVGAQACTDVMEIEDAGLDAPDTPDAPDAGEMEIPVIGGPFALDVDMLEITVHQGETVLVPVRIRRIPEYDARVTITADGLPEGTHASAVRDDDDGNAMAIEIEADDDAPAVQRSPFVISALGTGHRRTWRVTLDVIAP
jgi:hypothetical protein